MAELKRALPERARCAAVLNADDAHCRDMIDAMTANTLGLVSMQSDAAELNVLGAGRKTCLCVLEKVNGTEWLVLHDAGQRMALLPVDQVPATFEGTARFNVSNAMHAALAAYLAGICPDTIVAALGGFAAGHDTTPGRLNVCDSLPFKVVMDYAHNIDGYRQILNFIDHQAGNGRKILMLGALGDRLDEDIRAAVGVLAGRFDHYVCRNYHIFRGRPSDELPAFIKEILISQGVPEAAISTVLEPDQAIPHTLSVARPGDFVLLLVDNAEIAKGWKVLDDWAAEHLA
jgi:cyanophycin synthetase